MLDSRFRRRPRAARFGVEVLEGRRLLAVGPDSAFLSVTGTIAARGERDAIPLAVDDAAFDLPGGRVLISLTARPAAPGRLDPAAPRLGATHGAARLLRTRPNIPGGRAGYALAEVGVGSFVAIVGADRRTTGGYRLDATLAGDVDGDLRVDATDLARIAAAAGSKAGRRGYVLAADVDCNGRINRDDYKLAARNLGVVYRAGSTGVLTARLDADSDPDGDGHVLRPDVAIVGRARPGASVVLDAETGPDRATVADALGNYRFDVALPYGTSTLVVRSGSARTVVKARRSDVILDWNDELLAAIRADRTAPPKAAWSMAIVHLAAYDAVNAVTRAHTPYALNRAAVPGTSAEAAAAAAAHRALVALYPTRAATFDAALAAMLDDIADGPAENAGVALGRLAADTILDLRRNDGSDASYTYPGGPEPGHWRPTPDAYAPAVLPQWPFVRPFAMAAPNQFRPAGPPALGSSEYAVDLDEVRRLGAANSPWRTAEQTEIARFWADGAGTVTPPGHWNRIASGVARDRNAGLAENARTFALLNVALADAGIASWEAKYWYGAWRPITAIQQADRDGNPWTAADPSWTPLLATPPFPTYTSGHSTFSGAASEVLSFVFGPDTAFSTTSDDLPGVTRWFTSFRQAADEAGRSRIYGGIHFEFDNRDGLRAGRDLGRYVTRTILA